MFDVQNLLKYLLEGVAVAVAAFYIPKRKSDPKEILIIALTAAASFMLLDYFAPKVAIGARQGSGFGIGANLVGGIQIGGADPGQQTRTPGQVSIVRVDGSTVNGARSTTLVVEQLAGTVGGLSITAPRCKIENGKLMNDQRNCWFTNGANTAYVK